MSLTVGELNAYLRLDDSQFNSGVAGAEKKFGGLKASIGAGAKVIAGGLTTAAASAGVLGTALFKVGADYNRLQQNSRAALATLLGGTKAANEQMDKLDAFATRSPFAKQVFITAQQQLLGFGVAAKDVIPILDGVQNAVAAVGGSNDDVSSITYALAQMQGQGKLTGETLNQLGQYGIDAAGILGKEMGKTGAEIRRLASKPGGIPVDQVFGPLVDGMMKRFGGATDGIKKQMDGATDRIKGAWRDIGSAIAAPFIDPKGGGRAVEWANKVADLLRAVQQKVEPLVDLLVKRFGPQMGKVTGYLDKARAAVNGFDLSKVNGQLDRLTKYTPLISGAAAALFAFGSGSLPVLGKFLPAINPVVAGIAALVATSPELREVAQALIEGLTPLTPVLLDAGKALADVATEAIGTLAPALLELAQSIGPVIVSVVSSLTPALVGVVKAALPLVKVIGDVISWVAKLPTPVLASVTAFLLLRPLIATLPALFSSAAAGATTLGTALKAAFISNPVGLAITAAATALALFMGNQAAAKQRTDDFAQSLDEATGALTTNTRAVAFKNLQDDGTIDKAKKAGLSLDLVTDAALGNKAAIAQLTGEQDGLNAKLREMGSAADGYWDVRYKRDDISKVLKSVGVQTDAVTAAQQAWNDEEAAGLHVKEAATAATDTNTAAIKDNTAAKKEAAGLTLSQREAELAQADAQDAVTDAIERADKVRKDSKSSKKEIAAADRDIEKALLNTVTTYSQTRESMIKNNASAKEVTKAAEEQRAAFIKQAEAAGMSTKKAEKLADKYGLIPSDIRTDFIANTEKAQERTKALSSLIEGAGLDLSEWQISADGKHAVNTANGTVATINSKTGEITISGDDADALERARLAVTTINGKTATIKVDADTDTAMSRLDALLNKANGAKYTLDANGNAVYDFGNGTTKKSKNGKNGKATGGQITGPGTGTSDSILTYLSNGEHVWTAREVQALGGHGEVMRLRKAVLEGKIPAFAGGGAVGVLTSTNDRLTWARSRLDASKVVLEDARAESKAAAKSKDDKRKTRADKALDAAKQEVSDWRDEVSRLADQQRELTTDVRRKNIRTAVTGGLDSAYGVIDQLDEWSRNSDLSKKQRKTLASEAASAEKSLKSLYKDADGTQKALEKATDRLAELKSIRDGIASNLAGEFSLEGLTGEFTNAFGETSKTAPTAKAMVAGAQAKVAAIRSLTGKLDKLAALGLTGAILQEIAGEGTETGNLMADALLADTSQIFGLNQAYADIAKYSAAAGTAATKNTTVGGVTYSGGIADADSEVKGLNDSLDKTNAKIKTLGKTLESTLLGALGLKLNAKGQVVKKAGGGRITGGIPGIDSVDALLMPDEFVMRATQARKYGPLLEAMNSGADLSRFLTVQVPVGAAPAAISAPAASSADVTAAIAQMIGSAQIVIHNQVGLTDAVKADVYLGGKKYAIDAGAVVNGKAVS